MWGREAGAEQLKAVPGRAHPLPRGTELGVGYAVGNWSGFLSQHVRPGKAYREARVDA